MTTKKVASKSQADDGVVRVSVSAFGLTEDMAQTQLKAALAGAVIGGVAHKAYSCFSQDAEYQLGDVLVERQKAGDEAVKGDLGRLERMLMQQALTLDTIFNNLAERATRQEYIKNMDAYLRLALKAQSQARATAETLSVVKNPMPYIKQANIAQGHQQVNNGGNRASSATRTGKQEESKQTKILEQTQPDMVKSIPSFQTQEVR